MSAPSPDADAQTAALSLSARAHNIFTRAVQSLHSRRNAPPTLPIRVNPTIRITSPTPTPPAMPIPPSYPPPPPPIQLAMPWATVELSNYPPHLTHADVQALFQGFTISPDFNLPNIRNLAYPLRTFISVAGENEAQAAVRELCGRLVGGRKISVKMVEKTGYEETEPAVDDMADEMKNGIVNTARVYYPHLASKFLEVRERIQGTSNFAFLQARDPVTVHSEPEAHLQSLENKAKWELVAAGRSDCWAWKTNGGNERLAALKDLQDAVERQGQMRKLWGQWEESWKLDT